MKIQEEDLHIWSSLQGGSWRISKTLHSTTKRVLLWKCKGFDENGDPHKILTAYRQEIKKWPQLKPGDTVAYRKFFCFLIKCESLADETNWSVLNSLELLCMLISKLATSRGDNCNRKVQSVCRWHKREPDLAELIHFVDEETQLVNDPLYSWEAVQQ